METRRAALLIVGLPHDAPEQIERTTWQLSRIPFAAFDLRILRHDPASPLYDLMLSQGDVDEAWSLEEDRLETNRFLPGHLRVPYRHDHFSAMQLQPSTLTAMRELKRMTPEAIDHLQAVGRRARAPWFTAIGLSVRDRFHRNACTWLDQVEQTLAAAGSV